MKKLFIYFAICQLGLFASCSKTEENPQKTCKIISESSETGGKTTKTEYIYNAQGQVEKSNIYDGTKLVNYYKYTYANNNLTKLEAYYDVSLTTPSNTATFVYNSDNTVKEMNTFFETLTGKQPCKMEYVYNNDGNITQVSLLPVKSTFNPTRYVLKGYVDKLTYDDMENVIQVQRDEVTDKVNASYLAATYKYVIEEDYKVKLTGLSDAATLYDLFENAEVADYSEFSDNAPTSLKLIYALNEGKMIVDASVTYTYNADKLPTSAAISIVSDYQVNDKSVKKTSETSKGTYLYECK